MRLWPTICIGAAFFAAISLADRLSAIHEKRKQAYIEAVQAKLAERQYVRLVARVESTDWLSPLSKTTTLVYAMPAGVVFGKENLFGIITATYPRHSLPDVVSSDCIARVQTFTVGKGTVVVHEPEGADKSPKTMPGWIPDLCGDWSSELAALRSKRSKHRG